MIHGFKRTPARMMNLGAGWRLLVPALPWWRRGYLIAEDAFATGWWWFSIGFSIAPVGLGKGMHGINFRATWGWVTAAPPDEPYLSHLHSPL